MPVSVEEFAHALVATGIFSAEEVLALRERLPSDLQPTDGEAWSQHLIASGELTPFQAMELLSGGATPLALGDYVLLDKIGAGGMGQVFKAKHRHMDRLVAIKLLPVAVTSDVAAVQRFQREVKAAAKLAHPHIVQAYDASVQRGVWYLVLEYVAGRDLADMVATSGPLPIACAVDYIRQAARGLAYAHSKGVIHRDIKPSNLLVDAAGTVKILDMGLARIDDNMAMQAELTHSGQVMGTADYMAPEQASDTRHVDERADIYSLGCTLYRLLTGQNMYRGVTLVQKLLAHQQNPIPRLDQMRPDAPPALVTIFERMVAKSPDDRFSSMMEVEEALGQLSLAGNSEVTSVLMRGGAENYQSASASIALAPVAIDARAPKALSPTLANADPLQSTDPVSDRSLRAVREQAPPRLVTGKRWAPLLALSAGMGGAILMIAVGVWLTAENAKKTDVARLPVPRGGNVKVIRAALSPPTEAEPAAEQVNRALQFDGSNAWVELPLYDDLNGPLTIEAFVQPVEPLNRMATIVASFSAPRGFGVTIFDNQLESAISFADHPTWTTARTGVRPAMGEMNHVAAVYDGQALRVFLNGRQLVQPELPESHLPSGGRFKIGGYGEGDSFSGLIDEVRFSKVARYTSDFTPKPQHEPDADTLALYHCDEGQGDLLIDASDHKRHGKVMKTKWAPRGDPSANADATP